MSPQLTRRDLLKIGAGGAVAAGLDLNPMLQAALAAPRRCGRLSDIEHVVILIQENRSFDNYFGTFPGVRGFADPNAIKLPGGESVFAQPGYHKPGFGGHLYPFHLDTQHKDGECTNDINHSWGPQHRYWNRGRMDHWVKEHLKVDGPKNGPLTMGYYKRADLRFYYALAEAFTICDHYHCSVIGPTDPNRLYSMTATLDPAGKHGGPHLETLVSNRASKFGKYTWRTYPEQLEAHGVSWKVYADPDGNYGDNVLFYFKAYNTNPQLAAKAFSPTFPGTFQSDVAAGTLPQVSWVLAPLIQTEHPPAPVEYGEYVTNQVLSTLTSNPKVWDKTVLFVTWDENGGFFDHVPPLTAPRHTPGEYVTVNPLPSAATGIRGPIGLGFRVPLLICSPFTRGGFVSSDTFDHTSLLRFLETRFGPEVPNLTRWRRSVTGDLTSALNLGHPPNDSVPPLPKTSLNAPVVTRTDCPTNAPFSEIDEGLPVVQTYPVPPNHMPRQERGKPKRPSGCAPAKCSDPDRARDLKQSGHGDCDRPGQQ